MLLLVNDHVLKGAGLLPGWLTGKLSDFAGLVVAPVLVVALLDARTRWRRTAVFALVAAVFAAINVYAPAARALEALMAALGLSWRLTVDPTDLVALVVLPVGGWVLAQSARGAARRVRGARVLPRLGVVLGGVACIATSQNPPPPSIAWDTDAYVVNRSGRAVDVRLRWVSGAIDCDRAQREPGRYLTPTMFNGMRVTFTVADGETVPLQRIAAARASGGGDDEDAGVSAASGACDAVLIGADGMEDTLAFWAGLMTRNVPLRPAQTESTVGAVELIAAGTAGLGVRAPSRDVRLDPVNLLDGPPVCEPAGFRYEWSGRLPVAEVSAVALRDAPGGCTAVDYRDPGDNAGTLYLCMPRGALPFAQGEAFTAREAGASPTARTLVLEGPTRRTTVFSGTLNTMVASLLDLNVLERSVCAGRRYDCGAVTESVALDLVGLSAPLAPGQRATLAGEPSRDVWLGRAERVVVSSSACTDFSNLGLRADLALTQPR